MMKSSMSSCSPLCSSASLASTPMVPQRLASGPSSLSGLREGTRCMAAQRMTPSASFHPSIRLHRVASPLDLSCNTGCISPGGCQEGPPGLPLHSLAPSRSPAAARLTCHAAAAAGVAAGASKAAIAASATAAAAATTAASTSSIGHLVAVVLGWVILFGACFRSLPQILRIIKSKSTEGESGFIVIAAYACSMGVVALLHNACRNESLDSPLS